MKSTIQLLFIVVCNLGLAQTNLIDTSTWEVGNGSVEGFNTYGIDTENIRELGISPYGTSEVLWTAVPNTSNGTAGGFSTNYLGIDHSKTYRFTVWVKKTNSFDGYTPIGPLSIDSLGNNSINFLSGNPSNNPYFNIGDLPTLNNWYLLVGYVHHSAYTNTTSIGGAYNGITGVKDINFQDFKFTTSTVELGQRIWLADNTNTDDRQYYYAPTMYEVNGQEPTIENLLGINSGDTQTPMAPTLSIVGQTDATANISWSGATDNVGVTGYKVYKGGALEATLGNVSTYQATGLTAENTYQFTVSALDANGNESSPSNILSVTTAATSGGGGGSSSENWTLTSNDLYYDTGNVGIGTDVVPTGYKLAVNGSIITTEVLVKLKTNWPDYVFTENYSLPSLEEVERHIKEKGHLMNIPSAQEVETNGIELGKMNKLLLEKIEELTLYILKQEANQKVQQKNLEELKQEMHKIQILNKK